MSGSLSDRELQVATALAGAYIPSTEMVPERPEEVGFPARFRWFLSYLPGIERFLVRRFMHLVQLTPLLFFYRFRTFLGLSVDERTDFLERLADSRNFLARLVLKVGMLLTVTAYYADPKLRERLGDKTHFRVAEKSITFPVERGAEVAAGTDCIDVDVVVVGSGAGGAPLARELALRGRSVVVLEEGGYRPSNSYPPLAFDALTELYRDAGLVMSVGRPPVIVPVGKGVGGTTVVNSGTCFRVPDFVHRKWEQELAMPEALSADSLRPLYERVEEVISVQRVPPSILGGNNEMAKRGAEALGWSSGYLPRNFRGCVGNNRCAFGCPADAKQAMHLNYLPQAVEAGARVISGAKVQRVTFQGNRATGVVAHTRDDEGRQRKLEVRAKKVVVAAGTFYTPLLLRASGVRHRNLGRRLTLHPAIKISGLFPGEDFYSGPGVPQSYFVDEFQEQGVMMEGAHVPPDMTATSLPTRPSQHKALMERSRELALFGFLVSDEPSGTVHRGLAGRPFIRYDLSRGDYKKMIFGLKKLAQLFVAAGAEKLYMPTWRLPVLTPDDDIDARIDAAGIRALDFDAAAFHPLGTCGFGVDPETFPLDCDLKVRGREDLYVADGSVFPTSLAVNPQLSIMALATRCAFHLDEQLA